MNHHPTGVPWCPNFNFIRLHFIPHDCFLVLFTLSWFSSIFFYVAECKKMFFFFNQKGFFPPSSSLVPNLAFGCFCPIPFLQIVTHIDQQQQFAIWPAVFEHFCQCCSFCLSVSQSGARDHLQDEGNEVVLVEEQLGIPQPLEDVLVAGEVVAAAGHVLEPGAVQAAAVYVDPGARAEVGGAQVALAAVAQEHVVPQLRRVLGHLGGALTTVTSLVRLSKFTSAVNGHSKNGVRLQIENNGFHIA